MIKTKKIKDNIHGYVYISGLESLFLSHPLVLRLHHIRQNGSAYLTYPSARVHRYEHSLGAMHIAGLLLLNAIRYSPDPDIHATICSVVSHICNADNMGEIRVRLHQTAADDQIKTITKDGLYHMHSLTDINNDDTLATLLLFQATRIAMLVHDIGHPPFSHAFEMGLKQLGVKYQDHERVGLELLSLALSEIKSTQKFLAFTLAEMISKIVVAIVDRNNGNHRLVRGIAELVSGEVDADRLDYVRRDALSGGLSTNSYDIGRLYDAVKLVTDDKIWGTSASGMRVNSIELNLYAEALSTLEAFFSMRLHLYRWMLWHHSVVLRNMTLVSIVNGLSWLSSSSLHKINYIAKEVMSLATDPSKRANYWYFTDYYLLTKLTEIYITLKDNPDLAIRHQQVVNLLVDIETLVLRKKDYIIPLWKRPEHYATFAKAVLPFGPKPIPMLNEEFRIKHRESRSEVLKAIQTGTLPPEADNVDYHARKFCEAVEVALNAGLDGEDGRIRAYYLAKFRPAPAGMNLFTGGVFHPLESLAPSIPALEVAWNSLPQLWLFWDRTIAVEIGSKREIQIRCSETNRDEIIDKVAAAMSRFLSAQVTTP